MRQRFERRRAGYQREMALDGPPGTNPYEPTAALRTALAVVTATLHGDSDHARAAAVDLSPGAARFAVLVLAECLAQTLCDFALERADTTTAEELWQGFCLEAEHAIRRAAADRASKRPDH